MKNYKMQIDFLQELSNKELININGGTLVNDCGYAAHWVKDQVCCAWNEVKDWWNS